MKLAVFALFMIIGEFRRMETDIFTTCTFLTFLCPYLFAGATGVKAKTYSCYDGYFNLWDADENYIYMGDTPSYYNYLCAQPWQFNIQADPGYGCHGVVKSVKIVLAGPTTATTVTQKENVPPYMVFGDQLGRGFVYDQEYPYDYVGSINGRNWVEGDYSIEATFYSKANQKGDTVSTISADFYVSSDTCCSIYYDSSFGSSSGSSGGGGRRRRHLGSKPEGNEALDVLRGDDQG